MKLERWRVEVYLPDGEPAPETRSDPTLQTFDKMPFPAQRKPECHAIRRRSDRLPRSSSPASAQRLPSTTVWSGTTSTVSINVPAPRLPSRDPVALSHRFR